MHKTTTKFEHFIYAKNHNNIFILSKNDDSSNLDFYKFENKLESINFLDPNEKLKDCNFRENFKFVFYNRLTMKN